MIILIFNQNVKNHFRFPNSKIKYNFPSSKNIHTLKFNIGFVLFQFHNIIWDFANRIARMAIPTPESLTIPAQKST